MLGKIEGKRRRGQQRIKWLNSITNSMDMNLSEVWEIVKDGEAWHIHIYIYIYISMDSQRIGHYLVTEQ